MSQKRKQNAITFDLFFGNDDFLISLFFGRIFLRLVELNRYGLNMPLVTTRTIPSNAVKL